MRGIDMTYCATLKSGKIIVFNSDSEIESLLFDIEKKRWIEVVSAVVYQKLTDVYGENYEEVPTNRCSIRTYEIESVEYYVEKEVYR